MKPHKRPVTDLDEEKEFNRPGRESEDKPSPYGKGANKHQGRPDEGHTSGQIYIETEEEVDWPPTGIKPKD
jgi:hypothetical protein